MRELIVLQNKLKLQYDPNLTLNEIINMITAAHKNRKQCKQAAESLSLEYITQLALAKEENGDITAANFLKNINSVEATRRLFRNIRKMEGKVSGGSTYKLTTTLEGNVQEHTDKATMEQLCAEENEKKHHQTEDGNSQLLDSEYIDALGLHGEGPEIKYVMDGTYIPPASATPATVDFLKACKVNTKVKN